MVRAEFEGNHDASSIFHGSGAACARRTGPCRAQGDEAPAGGDRNRQRADRGAEGFTLSTTGAKPKTVAKLDKPIAPGGKAKVKLAGKGCDYVARWEFEDAGDESQVDLCHDPRIVLTD